MTFQYSDYLMFVIFTFLLIIQGWTKPNAFHVCITSYKLVLQDHQAFRRKSWKYLILDEAQNIKNFKSQRWQSLLNFNRCLQNIFEYLFQNLKREIVFVLTRMRHLSSVFFFYYVQK